MVKRIRNKIYVIGIIIVIGISIYIKRFRFKMQIFCEIFMAIIIGWWWRRHKIPIEWGYIRRTIGEAIVELTSVPPGLVVVPERFTIAASQNANCR